MNSAASQAKPDSGPREGPESPQAMTDEELVRRISLGGPVDSAITDEYYRRVIPFFRRMLGTHWHTGCYTNLTTAPGPIDQTRMIDLIADSIGLSAAESVLDVGCGIGGTVLWLAQTRAVQATGLTPVSEQIRIATEMIGAQGLDHAARVVQGHADRLPFPDASFDAVVFFESPCHFPDRSAFFREAFRVLRRGGRLAGEDWLCRSGLDEASWQRLIAPIHRTWSIAALGSGESYVEEITAAGFECEGWIDLRSESQLARGFMVERHQQIQLVREMSACKNPLEQLLLEGVLRLGQALAEEAFTIGRLSARKPVELTGAVSPGGTQV